MGEELRIHFDQLVKLSADLFEKVGLNRRDADVVARSYIENSLRGIDSHGIRLVPNCVKRLQEGGINPKPQIKVESETPATARLNGDNGLGQIVAMKGMNWAIEKAGKYGIGFVTCSNTNNAGAMGTYSRIALERGMAGLAVATTVPSMFAWGGLKRVISNPPVSITFPGKDTHFVLDISLGSVAWNKIYIKQNKRLPLPTGWAVDSRGESTADPLKAVNGGSVIPIGGHKGYGLTLAVELFTAILGGHLFGPDLKGLFDDPRQGEGISLSLCALDVSALIDSDLLKERVAALFSLIKSSPLKSGFSEILIPGEPEERAYQQAMKEGIPISVEVRDALRKCCAEFEIGFPG